MSAHDPLTGARLRLKVRAQELYEAGATKDQAYFMALEEAWKDELAENARLWDQAEEVAKLKHAISALIPWVASSGRGKAQEALADACELIGIDPLAWSSHPDVLLARRPDLNRRLA